MYSYLFSDGKYHPVSLLWSIWLSSLSSENFGDGLFLMIRDFQLINKPHNYIIYHLHHT